MSIVSPQLTITKSFMTITRSFMTIFVFLLAPRLILIRLKADWIENKKGFPLLPVAVRLRKGENVDLNSVTGSSYLGGGSAVEACAQIFPTTSHIVLDTCQMAKTVQKP